MVKKSVIKILVLDDEPFMLKLLIYMLAELGFIQVSTCESGRAALELFHDPNRLPDLILLDLNMPDMDGIEFIRHLVDRSYSGGLILISGENERILQTVENLVRAHKIMALGHLQKPVNPKELSALLAKWMPLCSGGLRAATRAYTVDEVRAAVIHGEFMNYYQPKVEVASGKVMGLECLARWRHPSDGMVFPDQFIEVAEEHGLIDALTRALLSEAFQQTAVWQDNGLDLRIALNISMDNLTSLGFADYVVHAAYSAGIKPSDIVLEVTESRLMKNLTVPLEILTRLRLKRFSLSIDDFGTGHSSLNQLRDFPFDELKVDRGFVHGAANNDTLRAIYGASLSLAQQLGMKSVAEGVEDRADWDFVCSTGCDFAQGYFIAKPMPASEIPNWISAWETEVKNLMELRLT